MIEIKYGLYGVHNNYPMLTVCCEDLNQAIIIFSFSSSLVISKSEPTVYTEQRSGCVYTAKVEVPVSIYTIQTSNKRR